MTPEYRTAFFNLHKELPREGPGEPADVAWAAACAGLGVDAEMADVACGPGADIAALLAAAPQGHVTALDKVAQFVGQARARWSADDRATIIQADMAAIANTYDLIWCAGAVYFLGIETALTRWRKALRPGGVIAFSEACWFGEDRSDRARALWSDFAAMTDEAGIAAHINAAGYDLLGTRRLSPAAWETYFQPLDDRIAALRAGADTTLIQVLDEAEEEAACWRAHSDEFGYVLSVVRPK